MKKKRWLILGVTLIILGVACSAFTQSEKKGSEEKEDTDKILAQAFESLEKQKSARFKLKMEVITEKMKLLSMDLSGEMISPDKFHTQGQVSFFGMEIPVDSYVIGEFEYDQDPQTGKWEKKKKEEIKKKEEEETPNPLGMSKDLTTDAQFKLIEEKKLGDVECLVYEFKPEESKVEGAKEGKVIGRILIEKESKTFRKLYLKTSGKDEEGKEGGMLIEIEFYDFGAPITIKPPS